jgi:hypothetical protein
VHNRSAQPRAGLAALQRGGALPAAANVSRASGAQLSQQQQQQQQQQYEAELTDEQRSEITESVSLEVWRIYGRFGSEICGADMRFLVQSIRS